MLVDKITIDTIISKKTEEKVGVEDIFLSDIPWSSNSSNSSNSGPILTIFTVFI
jgi:hypothetical protein